LFVFLQSAYDNVNARPGPFEAASDGPMACTSTAHLKDFQISLPKVSHRNSDSKY
jgi:hypothetical protein